MDALRRRLEPNNENLRAVAPYNPPPKPAKTYRSVGTQTLPTKRKKPNHDKEVESILDHKTEGSKMGVRFFVAWKGYNVETFARLDEIIAGNGRQILIEYLLNVKKLYNRKFKYMLDNEPELWELLKKDQSE